MGCLDSPNFFCAVSETVTDVANTLVDTYLPVSAYGDISALRATEPIPPHTTESRTHIDCFMDDVISVVQGGTKRQHQVFDGTVFSLKWILLLLPGESKESVSLKNF